MIRILLAAAAVVAAMAFQQRPAQAEELPWCVTTQSGNDRCRYNTLEDCTREAVAGSRGFCNPNPRYHGDERRRAAPAQPSRRRH